MAMAWWHGIPAFQVEGSFRASQCRPIHGGYPQPAHWSAWPWCTELPGPAQRMDGVQDDTGALAGKRPWPVDSEVFSAKRFCAKQAGSMRKRAREVVEVGAQG
mmetsp:Transcript_8999/g.20997  ORF Transcript_8999/g.20997 Transcript_8999/m.20997 type:complete len:103 (+) Transcript_8999:43-351(+)